MLIVGGGPAGLATAIRCAGRLKTVVVHKDKEIGRPVRTSGGSWTQRLPSLPIPESCYQNIDSLSFLSGAEEATFRFGKDHPIVFDTERLYAYLADKAAEAGATILTDHTFLHAEQDAVGDFTSIVRHEGHEIEFHSRYLVEASGYSRAAARKVIKAGLPKRTGVGYEIHLPNTLKNAKRAHLLFGRQFFPKGYGWLFPMPGDQFRFGIGLIDPDKGHSPDQYLNRAVSDPAFLGRIDAKLTIDSEREFPAYSGLIPADGPWTQVVHGRLLCVGDSCGQNLPTVGEGIRFCIEAGLHLGSSLARAASSNEQRALRDYSDWWTDTLLRRFQIGYNINKAITDFSDQQWDKGIRLLRLLDAEEIVQLLRLEHVTSLVGRLLFRKPSLITDIGKRAIAHILG